MQAYLKILLVAVLLACLFRIPYGYYQLACYIALIGFVVLAYQDYMGGRKQTALLFLILAMVFQPVFKLELTREIWCIIDVAVVLYLFVHLYRYRKI